MKMPKQKHSPVKQAMLDELDLWSYGRDAGLDELEDYLS